MLIAVASLYELSEGAAWNSAHRGCLPQSRPRAYADLPSRDDGLAPPRIDITLRGGARPAFCFRLSESGSEMVSHAVEVGGTGSERPTFEQTW